MSEQPTLTTDRLALRPFTLEDAPVVQQLAGDKDVASPTVSIPHPYELEHAQKWIESQPEYYEQGKEVNFAITLSDTGDLAGAIGLKDFHPQWQFAEIGYWIGKPYWNQGYATEAARAVLDYAFNKLNLNRIHAHHMTRNPASGCVMKKIGMTQEGLMRQCVYKWGRYEDVALWAILKSDWQL